MKSYDEVRAEQDRLPELLARLDSSPAMQKIRCNALLAEALKEAQEAGFTPHPTSAPE